MQYYLMGPGDTEDDLLNEANLLGEVSFNTFWPGTALTTLMTAVDKHPEMLPILKIRSDSTNKIFTIEEFLLNIQNLKIRSSR